MREVHWDSISVFRVYLNPKLRKVGTIKYSREYIGDIDLSKIKTRKEFDAFLIDFGFHKISNKDAENSNERYLQFNPRIVRNGRGTWDKKIGAVKIMNRNIVFVHGKYQSNILEKYLKV